jgi:FAD/FMN-containing dehydrogenase
MIPVSLQRYDIPALRTVLDIFTTMPPALRSSAMMLEARADNAILRVPSASTAYPHRADRLLFSPVLTYAPTARFDATADDFARRIRSALLKGSGAPLAAYVNYARGDESVEDLYGHEAWRLEKLRRLKAEFDPLRRFSFYAPIE